MLTYQWTDKTFAVDSLNARRPVSAEDELIVICCPDPFGAEECQRTVRQVAEQDEKAGVMDRPIVLFNQRLSRWVTHCIIIDTECAARVMQKWLTLDAALNWPGPVACLLGGCVSISTVIIHAPGAVCRIRMHL
jgi:hypothetical protein